MNTRFGEFGGQYIPEVLMNEAARVQKAFEECREYRKHSKNARMIKASRMSCMISM